MKADPKQLPYLLALFDDESRTVRDAVLAKLSEYSDLDAQLRTLSEPLPPERLAALRGALGELRARARGTRFAPGDLVRHRRYGYRGLVVSLDATCQASREWYERNQTQPDRGQPWYHVLVDGSTAVTYAAESNLIPDESSEEIQHGYVPYFFERTPDGRYVRNSRRWPTAEGESSG